MQIFSSDDPSLIPAGVNFTFYLKPIMLFDMTKINEKEPDIVKNH